MCNIRLQASKLARNWKISLWCGRTSGRGNGRAYGHVTTKFSRMDSLPHFLSFRKYSRLTFFYLAFSLFRWSIVCRLLVLLFFSRVCDVLLMVFRSSLESWLSLPHHIEPASLLRYSLVLIVNAARDFRAKYNVSLRDFQAIEFGLLPECFEKQFKGMIYTIRMHKNGRMLNLFRLNLNFARSRPATENPTPVTTFWRYLRLSYLELCY